MKNINQKNTCFMIMPFDDSFNAIYGVIKEEAEKMVYYVVGLMK